MKDWTNTMMPYLQHNVSAEIYLQATFYHATHLN